MLSVAIAVFVYVPAVLFYILLGVAIHKVCTKEKQSEEWHKDDGK